MTNGEAHSVDSATEPVEGAPGASNGAEHQAAPEPHVETEAVSPPTTGE